MYVYLEEVLENDAAEVLLVASERLPWHQCLEHDDQRCVLQVLLVLPSFLAFALAILLAFAPLLWLLLLLLLLLLRGALVGKTSILETVEG